MRLLFLSAGFPLPANNGHKMRTWALLRALAGEGHDVTLLTFAKPDEVNDNSSLVRKVCRHVEAVPLEWSNLSTTTNLTGRLLGLFSFYPYGVERFVSNAMQERIRSHLGNQRVDAIVCDIFTFINLPSTMVPVVLNNENVEHLILQRYLAHEWNPAKWTYAWLESRKMLRWERQVCRHAVIGMACSETDRAVLQVLCPDMPTVVAPNVVDTETYTPAGEGDALTVLFQGGMDWYPNRDAVEFFVSQILPKLRRLVSGVKFLVAGRNPLETFCRRFAGVPGVEFTGTVPDMREEIARAAVCVVPLRIGSGTRLKILEAGAMGKPIVSTRVGAEGLEFADGEEILLVDEPKMFAQAVASLLSDASRRRALGQAARQRVEKQYSFPILQAAIRKALAELRERLLTVTREPRRQPLVHEALA